MFGLLLVLAYLFLDYSIISSGNKSNFCATGRLHSNNRSVTNPWPSLAVSCHQRCTSWWSTWSACPNPSLVGPLLWAYCIRCRCYHLFPLCLAVCKMCCGAGEEASRESIWTIRLRGTNLNPGTEWLLVLVTGDSSCFPPGSHRPVHLKCYRLLLSVSLSEQGR